MHAMSAPKALREPFRLGLSVLVLGAATLSVQAWVSNPHASRTAGFAAATALARASLLLLLALALTCVVIALRPKRTMQQALMVVASFDTALGLAGNRPLLALAGAVGLSLVIAARSLWTEISDRGASRLGHRLLAGAAILVIGLFLLERPRGTLLVLFVLLLLTGIGAGLCGLILLSENAPLPGGTGPVTSVYQAHAVAGISPFTLMHDKRYFWNRERTAYLAYAGRTGAAIVLGPGVGPAQALPALYAEFEAEAHRRGWRVGFYQVPAAMSEAGGSRKRIRIGCEAIIDLASLTLKGPIMAKLRHEISRGRRNGVTVTLLPDSEISSQTRRAMRRLNEMHAQHKGLGEMGFSVGRSDDVPAAPTTVGLAHDAHGELLAYASWLWLPAARGVALDSMRRNAGAPGGTMDLLLYASLDSFRSQATWASLGLAPAGGPSASSLSAFKAKFRPRWEPRYLVAGRLSDWPAVAASTVLVHYPRLALRLPHPARRPSQWIRTA